MFASGDNRSTRVVISKVNLQHNIDTIKRVCPKQNYLPVLQNNAYGHGLAEVYKLLQEIDSFPLVCVSTFEEALKIHRLNPKQEVLILGYVDAKQFPTLVSFPFHVTIWDLAQIPISKNMDELPKFHLFIDTGMHREGVSIEDLEIFLQSNSLQHVRERIVGIASHYSSANDLADTKYLAQNSEFDRAIALVTAAQLPIKYIHNQASAGILRELNENANTVRMGLALYGISPLNQDSYGLKPILTLISTIAQIKKIKKTETVGYNGAYKANKDLTVALVPIGHSDGIDRRLGNQGVVSVRGCLCPIIGSVSMNVTITDISACSDAQVGDDVEVVSATPDAPNSVKSNATLCETTADEFLAHIGTGLERIVV